MINIRTIVLFSFIGALSACSQSQVFAPQAEQRSTKLEATSLNTDTAPAYIHVLKNPDLQAYLHQVLQYNYDLKSAVATIEAYALREQVVTAQRLPEVELGVNQQRAKTAETNTTDNLANVSLNISWVIDVWGRVADLGDALSLSTAQQILQYEQLRNVLTAQAVQGWLLLWKYQNLHDIITEQVLLSENALETTTDYYQRGQATYSELTQRRQARDFLLQEQAQVDALLKTQMHRLNILRGALPDTELPVFQTRVTPVIANLPDHISALTLLERPDIQAAFKEIEIFDAQTRAANKALLPQFTINAGVSESGETLSRVFKGDLLWQLVGGLTQPIFNGGQLRNEAKRRSKESESAFYAYEQVVLNAMEEIETGLVNEFALLKNMNLTEDRLAEMKNEHASQQEQLQSGAIDVQTYFEVSQQLSLLQKEWIEAQADYLSNRVLLALALGQSLSNQSLPIQDH